MGADMARIVVVVVVVRIVFFANGETTSFVELTEVG
jgi:hypothetical protein